ncbi:hypothetical protein GLP20_17185 [Photobacterium carnosum]|nr:hypothetical protein [Photobacterium carnosum]
MMLRILSYIPKKHFNMNRYFVFLSNRLGFISTLK